MDGADFSNEPARMAATREALGFKTQSGFAERLGMERNTWNPFETGARPLSSDAIRKIRAQFRFIPYEWIIEGDASKLPHDLYEKVVPIYRRIVQERAA